MQEAREKKALLKWLQSCLPENCCEVFGINLHDCWWLYLSDNREKHKIKMTLGGGPGDPLDNSIEIKGQDRIYDCHGVRRVD